MKRIEIWKDIPGYEGWFLINNFGRVTRSDGKPLSGSRRKIRGKPIGYAYVRLSKFGVSTTHLIHHLVMYAFRGPRPYLYEINHKDGDKGNNSLSNLEYLTKKQNIAHALNSGLCSGIYGVNHYLAKLSEADVRRIRSLIGKVSRVSLAAEYLVSYMTIYRVQRYQSYIK